MPLTQVSARFFLELALGLLVSLAATDRRSIGAGFSRLMAAFVLASLIPGWLLARSGGTPLPPIAGPLAGAFLAATLVVLFAAGRISVIAERLVVAAGCACGAAALLIAVADSRGLHGDFASIVQLASGAGSMLVLGFVTGAMILGHWYLVTPDLPVAHLGRLTKLATIAAYAKLALLVATIVVLPAPFRDAGRTLGAIVGACDAPGGGFSAQLDVLWLVARIAIGVVGPAVLGHMTLATVKLKATQPATGILYAATVMVLMGELFAFVAESGFKVVL